ncbi:MAG: RecQ family ATP-dependent DNA helicase [Marinilabiliaceae bacterium]|nr:RecQ family ATP-dependent DNA helicase [Marinilabiliaceae bacterium]
MEKYLGILKKYWGYDSFRDLQGDIIKSIIGGYDTLGLMPTGGGKSITFQVPALCFDGICIVITPLIALMKDQVANLLSKGIKAIAIHSGLSREEISIALDNATFGGVKFMYVSPERLGTVLFRERLPQMNISFIAVDEAHCISQWGYDFRPSYLKVAEIRDLMPQVPLLALTATATPEVVDDIQNKLRFSNGRVFKMSYRRSNLAYVVRYSEQKEDELLKILRAVNGSAVVYVRNRKKTKELAHLLVSAQISADYYHAGLSHDKRDLIQQRWMNGAIRVMVATNAFGMGIDKSDVRLVVHMDSPDSLEAYFQEAGRAGRDRKKAFAVLLWSNNDKVQLKRKISTNFPDRDVVKRVYVALGNFFQLPVGAGYLMTYDFNMGRFCESFGFNMNTVLSSLKILERAEYLEFYEDLQMASRIHFIMQRDDLYKFQVANEAFDGFIKLLLRSYTGLFIDYVVINEEQLASRASTTVDVVYTYLQRLNHLKVIKYIPQRKGPHILYTRSREDLPDIVINSRVYDERKENFEKRVFAVIDYATTSYICRSKMLLNYFGETKSDNCGKCDVCQNKKKTDINENEFDSIVAEIKNELLMGSLSVDMVINKLSFDKNDVVKVLRWLEDNAMIIEDDGLFEWTEK